MTDRERTPRGFVVFGHVEDTRGLTIRVQESSVAFEGARVWLFLHEDGEISMPAPHLSVTQAEALAGYLLEFIRSARADELTEPAEPESDDA